jgi:hydroxypyruvate isomerase
MEFGLCIESVFDDLTFEQRVKKAADLGFEKLEMWFVDLTFKGNADELLQIQQDNKVQITNTVIGAPDGSIGGGMTDPKNRNQWLERAKMTLDMTSKAKIPAAIVCTGNVVPGMTTQQMTDSVLACLEETVKLADKYNVNLLLEPLNTPYDHEGYFLDNSDMGADFCRKINSKRLKLLYDCYHMQIMEGDMIKHIEKNFDVIGHFHSAAVPGRGEHYNGETNYPFVIKQIEKMGYKGIFGLEYFPKLDDHAESITKVMQYLQG